MTGKMVSDKGNVRGSEIRRSASSVTSATSVSSGPRGKAKDQRQRSGTLPGGTGGTAKNKNVGMPTRKVGEKLRF